jgi:hypothetical protein
MHRVNSLVIYIVQARLSAASRLCKLSSLLAKGKLV